MSEYERKHDAAMKELEATGMWPSNYAPPVYHLCRKLGMQVRPPHYTEFLNGMIAQGLFFAIVWGVVMWVFDWRERDLPLEGMVLSAVFAGTLFGLAMSLMCAYGRRKWNLTAWEDL